MSNMKIHSSTGVSEAHILENRWRVNLKKLRALKAYEHIQSSIFKYENFIYKYEWQFKLHLPNKY